MGIGLIVVEKEFEGEVWSNVWGFGANGGGPTLDDVDLNTIGASSAITDAGEIASPPATLLGSLLAFERALQGTHVKFRQVYVTDGQQNGEAGTSPSNTFFVATLAYSGNRNPDQGPLSLVPGSVTLQLNKNPAGFSQRRGRAFLRGVLLEGEIRMGGRGLVDWTDQASRTAVATRISSAVTTSGLDGYMGNQGDPADAFLGIPKFVGGNPKPANYGNLIGMFPIGSFAVVGPVSRQVKRGRKNNAS